MHFTKVAVFYNFHFITNFPLSSRFLLVFDFINEFDPFNI